MTFKDGKQQSIKISLSKLIDGDITPEPSPPTPEPLPPTPDKKEGKDSNKVKEGSKPATILLVILVVAIVLGTLFYFRRQIPRPWKTDTATLEDSKEGLL